MIPETFRVRNDAGIDECLTTGAGRKPTRRDVDHLVIAEAVEVRTEDELRAKGLAQDLAAICGRGDHLVGRCVLRCSFEANFLHG